MDKTARPGWGIMGAGGIVHRWINGARQAGIDIRAIASRTAEHAKKTAVELGIPEAVSYEELVRRDDIDICYIAVPHPFHMDLAVMAMDHGKHVLVEKPAAVNAAQWQKMCETAKKNNVFLMEAVWTRFFPAVAKLRELFTEGNLGPVKTINCTFSGFLPASAKDNRNLRPDLAGGGLLDMGVYCLHLCDMIYGCAPEEITGFGCINTDENRFGVDEQAVYIARYKGQRLAMLASGVRTAMRDTAFLYAENTAVRLPRFWKPTELFIQRIKGWGEISEECLSFEVPSDTAVTETFGTRPDEGFQFEIRHVEECVLGGLRESPEVGWAVTDRVLKQCDELRNQWGLKYPFE